MSRPFGINNKFKCRLMNFIVDINKIIKGDKPMFIEGEVPYVSTGNNNNNNGWNDWSWIVALALIGGLFGGNGFGFGGGFGNRGFGGGIAENYALATDFATIERKLDGVNNGICDSTFALNNTITTGNFNTINAITQASAGLNTALVQGFNGIDNAICTLGYQNQAGFNMLSRELADCCCTTKSAIADVKYANERNTCSIIEANNTNTRAILDFLTNEKISSLQAENSGLKAQISNDRQSRYIVDALSPKCPQPAYVVQPPQEVTFPTNCCGNVAYANYGNNSCCL